MRVFETRVFPFLLLLFLASCTVVVPHAHATSYADVPIDSLWVHADCVVEGNVVQIWSGWTPDSTSIRTWIQLDVLIVHAGPCVIGLRTLGFWGGETDSVASVVDGTPSFAVGERVLLFLDERPGVLFPTLGLDMGKFTVSINPTTGEERLVSRHYGRVSRSSLLQAKRARGPR